MYYSSVFICRATKLDGVAASKTELADRRGSMLFSPPILRRWSRRRRRHLRLWLALKGMLGFLSVRKSRMHGLVLFCTDVFLDVSPYTYLDHVGAADIVDVA